MSQGFGTSARKAENGFMRSRNVSSLALRRNIRAGNVNYFNNWDGLPPVPAAPGAGNENGRTGLIAPLRGGMPADHAFSAGENK
jgi:hypothetical protein